jgi:RNA polymerase sigma factor (sigma-70 family)
MRYGSFAVFAAQDDGVLDDSGRCILKWVLPKVKSSELFASNLALIERVIAVVCRRSRVFGADAEDFSSNVKVALIDNDYAILRKYEGRSSLATFLSVVIQRLLSDERMQALGRWRPSSEAEKLGDVGVLLETLICRDHRSLDEALPLVRGLDPALTREQVAAMAERLPERATRPRLIELDEEHGETFVSADSAESRTIESHRRTVSNQTSSVIRDALDALPVEDRMIIRFRFVQESSIADISRMLRLPQRPLYRRLEAILQRLRSALTLAGIDATDVAELIGEAAGDVDFGFAEWKNAPRGQSLPDERARSAEEAT